MSDAGRGGRLAVPGGSLAWDATGSGPAILLVHAGLADRRMWDDIVPALARHRTVVRYDGRGYGETTVTEDVPYSNRADTVALLDHLAIEQACLIGASRGGSIAIDTAIETPARVSALVLVGSGLSGADVALTDDETAAFAEIEDLETAGDWRTVVDREIHLWVDGLGQSPDRVPHMRERVREMALDAARLHAGEPLDRVIALDPPAAGRLGELRIPTLILVGDLDIPRLRTVAGLLNTGIAGSRLETWPGVAHLPSMERPAAFVDLLERFLDTSGA